MLRFLGRIIFLTLAVMLADYLIAEITVADFTTAILAGVALTIIHTIVKPIIKILTLPITIITLGLFLIVLNVLFFWFVGGIVPGMTILTFTAAFFGSVVVSIVNWLYSQIFKKRD